MTELSIAQFIQHIKLVDLTHSLNPSVPSWNGNCGFGHTLKMDYEQGCRVQSIRMLAGIGTHIDAPSHFIKDADSVADLVLQNLFAPIALINVSDKANASYMVSLEDILAYEAQFGRILPNSFVIAYTGWDKYWLTPHKYRNPNHDQHMEFPGFLPEAVELLISREIVGVGIDTLSPDGSDMSFPVHHLLLGKGKYIVENLANCQQLPPTGAYIMICPLKIEEATESPIRAIGFIPILKENEHVI